MKEAVYNIIGTVGTILLLGYLASWIFVSKNNGKKYTEEYINTSKELKVKVNPVFFEEIFSSVSYFKGTAFFKGFYGNTSDQMIKDDYSNRYFKLMRFDPYGDKFRTAQSGKIDNKELIVKVDPLQYNDKNFGTKENPILVFWYRGVDKDFVIDMDIDELDEKGMYKQVPTLISPTEQEYRYNVEQYLTYVMPKAEFKARFKN